VLDKSSVCMCGLIGLRVRACIGVSRSYWVLPKEKGRRGGSFGLSFEIHSVNCFFRRHIVGVFALRYFLLFYFGSSLIVLGASWREVLLMGP